MIFNRFYKYDYLLIILVSSLAFGAFGGALRITRVLTILFLPFLFYRLPLFVSKIKQYIYFILFFFTYCFISVFWTTNLSLWGKELIYNIIHFSLFLEIIIFSYTAKRPLDSLSKAWMIAIGITLIIAFWEIITDNHLSISSHGSDLRMNMSSESFIRKYASTTFYNYNGYVTFLCFSMPFIYYKIAQIKQYKLTTILPVIILLLSFTCILFNASRGGLSTMICMVFIYMCFLGKNKSIIYFLLIIFILFLTIALFFDDSLFKAILTRNSSGNLFEDMNRFRIWENVWKVFMSTYGLGTGPGVLQLEMSKITSGIIIPHNMFFELLAGYGVVLFFLFIRFLFGLVVKARKMQVINQKIVIFTSLLTLPLYSVIDSGYLLNEYVFVSFASLVVFTNIIVKTQD